MPQEVKLRSGVWYDDRSINLSFPDSWDVRTYRPNTPAPLTDKEIQGRMNAPFGQPPLRELAVGKKSPLIITDDLSRPTPVWRVMPFLLEEFRRAGIRPEQVRILVATGTHGAQDRSALGKKLGEETFKSCRVLVHSDTRRGKFIGRTTFGTPVFVNPELVKSDLIVGIGGVYPQHATGFGGGSKLALGVLARRSITHLHYSHEGVDGGYDINNNFRGDLTEIARIMRLNTICTLHVNGEQEIVNMIFGDHFEYYPEAAKFSRERFAAPVPEDADVVIANTYPSDVSYTFMRKGMKVISCAPPNATRIVIASNCEGLGHHGLFPQGRSARFLRMKRLYSRISIMDRKVILKKIFKNIFRLLGKNVNEAPEERDVPEEPPMPKRSGPLWIYRPPGAGRSLPPLEGIQVTSDWKEICELIKRDHPTDEQIKVRIYSCSSLQCIDTEAVKPVAANQ